MNYLEVQNVLAKNAPHLNRFFADRWCRFPSDLSAGYLVSRIRESAGRLRQYLPESAAELDQAADEIEKRK